MVSGIFFFCFAVKDAFISSTLVPGGALIWKVNVLR